MTRILSECSASVRKSLQGLDYFAAEGARAFDDLRGCLCKNHPLNFASKIILPETLLTERLYQV